MPVPNCGIEAAALAKLAVHVQALQTLLALLPAGGDISRDLREAINKVAKHVPPGAINQGVQMTEAQRSLMQTRQQGPQMAAKQASQMQQPPQGGPSPSPMAG